MSVRADASLQPCLNEALALARVWIPRWLEQVGGELSQREAAALHGHEKHGLGHARTELVTHRDLLASRFLEALEADLLNTETVPAPGSAKASNAPRRLTALSFDELELMDDHQVQQTVDLARWQQVVKMACDEELAAFSARLSRAQGFDVVRIEANPLKPDAVVAALVRAMDTLRVPEDVRARWLHVGALMLGQSLVTFYRQLEQWLEAQGVAAAGYVVIQAPESRGVLGATALKRATDSLPAAASLSGRDPLLTLDHLHQLLVGNLEQSGAGSGNAMVRNLAAEVVTLLLRRIAEDNRLLRPVRDLVQMLKDPLLQLARSEPRFFADRQNPARQLLDDITARSLAFTSEQDAGFDSFAHHVLDAVKSVLAAGSQLADQLPGALQRFQAAVSPAAVPAQGLALQTLVRVEQRNLLAERIADEIEARPDFARAPGLVRRFLTGPWAQVIAHARLSTEAGQMPGGADAPALRFMDVLPDLLWSSQLAQASRNRPRLIKIIPHVLRTLREGLDTVEYPRGQSEPFFQALMGLHEAAYKTQHLAGSEASPGFDLDDERADRHRSVEPEPWIRETEARESGFMTDADMLPTPDFADTQPLTSDWQGLQVTLGDALRVGAWIDLQENGQTQRCQLTWASPHGRIFLFTAPGGRSVSLSRSGLDRLQRAGLLRVVAEHGVLDDALDSVARLARDNSARH
jgi:hypothetical protein